MVKAAKVATLLRPDGTAEQVVPAKKGKFSLEEVQKLVGGYVARVPLPGEKGAVLLVDEEGLPKELPLNRNASELAGQMIVGNALFIPKGMGW